MGPVKHKVIVESLRVEELPKKFPQIIVVGFLLESERPDGTKVLPKFLRQASAEVLDRCSLLSVQDLCILVLLRLRIQALPGKRTTCEVNQDVSECLQVVPSGLLNPHVSGNRGVSRCPGQRLSRSVWNMLVSDAVSVPLAKPKVQHVHQGGSVGRENVLGRVCRDNVLRSRRRVGCPPRVSECGSVGSDQKVVRFDVTMEVRMRMEKFDPVQHLVSQHEYSLEGESSVTAGEELLQGRPQKFNHNARPLALVPPPVNSRNAELAAQHLVNLGLIQQLRVFTLQGFQLDGDLLPRRHVSSGMNLPERSTADFPSHSVFSSRDRLRGSGQLLVRR
mmetsp:Transcript_49555/g.97593  ORF Transcript_49555/g.97593 Transcript_49555/m.97593 type:complete len:334 (-) Transcript_49555:238-1239(-)